ncbi:3-phosphoglycerate dehydrogenase [Clostridium fermenticellae]|uniref:3-phosphoglycerate dehydrogenase n=1 Tax=Clostridium fermenticellae TaxID=2068654 RepID=A0A386H0B7_9CLOT|nr:D-2-hydroxyacid dehydrogenase [Clostridium fermenticellae]AYD39085.1 3-phosphoglycerate dehydrogenase [Clostridium fermenticellae]
MLKILVCDGIEKNALNELLHCGFEVKDKHYETIELKRKIKDYDIVIVRSATKIMKEIIDEGVKGRLKLIIRGGVGVDNIDVEYARNKGIQVRNTPNASSISVAELTLAHMFAVTRFIPNANITMRNGEWNKKQYKGIELYGKTLGLVGFGRIAREVAKRAEVIGMKVIYTDKLGETKGFDKYKFVDLENLFKKSDFISFHIPFNKGDKPIVDFKEFELMKDGVYIINCARGGIINENALLEAIQNEKVAGAAMDVFLNEPEPNSKLVNNPRVSVTPHIGASTKEAQKRIGEEIVGIVEEFTKLNDKFAANA